jgi:glycosyltransferase involved in cell wall biosynthesis
MSISVMFSVIVPTRDRLGLVEQTLLELKKQTYQDVEFIVVDDGSSAAVRAEYPALWDRLDARFRLVLLGPAGHPGSGPSKARNHGISLARSRFLAFCDDDDQWCASDHLAVAARALSARPDCGMYVANQIGVREGSVRISDWLPAVTGRLSDRPRLADCNVYVVPQADLIESNAFPHLNILIVSSEIANAVGGFWEKAPYEGDLDFFWRCLDRVDAVLMRPDVVSIHNIPNPSARDNVSTQSSQLERWLLRSTNCRHVVSGIRSLKLIERVLNTEGDALRHLAVLLESSNRPGSALLFALQALAGRYSFKWLGYAGMLILRRRSNRPRSGIRARAQGENF